MMCPKCGIKNKTNAVYCEKCLLPLNDSFGEKNLHNSSGNMLFSDIMVIVLCVVMVIALLLFPLFTDGIFDIINFSLKSKDSLLNNLKDEISRYTSFGSEQIFGIILPIIAMIVSLIFTIVGVIAKKYTIQNVFAFFNLVFIAPIMIYSGVRLHLFPSSGCYLYVVLSICVIYFTQDISNKKNMAVIIGLVAAGIGTLTALIGYFTNDNSFVSDLSSVAAHNITELIGIIIIVVGGIVSIVGFEKMATAIPPALDGGLRLQKATLFDIIKKRW